MISSTSTGGRSWYQSWWGDHWWHWWHCVSRQTLPHSGHWPCVSNVCQAWPHSQVHSALAGGSHSHFGQ
ncbi:MAG: hypothetical protein ABEL97_01450 [Salinibacter sp.]